jgi:hypothetical protein
MSVATPARSVVKALPSVQTEIARWSNVVEQAGIAGSQ